MSYVTFATKAPHASLCQKLIKRHGSASAVVKERLEKELDGIRAAGTWKTERVITSKQDVSINVLGSEGKILNFCANNYLGLSVSIFAFVHVVCYQYLFACLVKSYRKLM